MSPASQHLAVQPIIDFSRKILSSTSLEQLYEFILSTAVKYLSAMKGFIIIERGGSLLVEADIDPVSQDVRFLRSVPIDRVRLPRSIVRYTARTGKTVMIGDSPNSSQFGTDPYMKKYHPKSVLCRKISLQGTSATIIYLEHMLLEKAFSSLSPEILSLLSSEMAIALENARLYREQEQSLRVRNELLLQYEDSRHKNLQDRMLPHFIFNAIHTIHAILRIDPARADAALLIFADISRYFTYRSFESLVPFTEEWQFTERYLEFERIRLKERFACSMSVNGNFIDIAVPPLILQPLVENSIKHGFRNKKKNASITITANRTGHMIAIEVNDNGVGLRVKDPFTRTLDNILNRLRFHYINADMEVNSVRDKGVRILISFSIERKKNSERGRQD